MSKIQEIKDSLLQARKSRDTLSSALLSTLLGEALMIGKNDGNRESTDAEVIKVIKKFIANNEETIKLTGPNAKLGAEIVTLESFLPAQLSADELDRIISDLILKGNNMGQVMKLLKEQYAGTYDGAAASALIKAKL
jgi:uncharacterized protein YqeY